MCSYSLFVKNVFNFLTFLDRSYANCFPYPLSIYLSAVLQFVILLICDIGVSYHGHDPERLFMHHQPHDMLKLFYLLFHSLSLVYI